MKRHLWALVITVVLLPSVAKADVSFFMLESVGISGEYSGAGHAAIYISNICPEGPVSLRLCRPGEMGAVISTYPDFGANAPYEWMAVPVLPYLYGVEDERDIPLYANGETRNFLREAYGRKHLTAVIANNPDGSLPQGNWRTMLTMAFNRDIYSFNIKTTPEEDARFLKEFMSRPNQNHFKNLKHNCADFVRETVNIYFPGATRKDVINDFAITTPKALAKSLTEYATVRPWRLFNVSKYNQVAGPIWRSNGNHNFTEHGFTSKKYVIPSLIFNPYVFAGFAGTYFITGRFDAQRTYKAYSSRELAQLRLEGRSKETARRTDASAEQVSDGFAHADTGNGVSIKKAEESARTRLFGDGQTWKRYREAFAPRLAAAIDQAVFLDEKEVKTFFRDLELQSQPAFDENGGLILKVKERGVERLLGLTRGNILGANSDTRLAYKLMLAKVYSDLNAKERNRDSLVTFEADWALLNELSARYQQSDLYAWSIEVRRPFLDEPVKTSSKRKWEKFLIALQH